MFNNLYFCYHKKNMCRKSRNKKIFLKKSMINNYKSNTSDNDYEHFCIYSCNLQIENKKEKQVIYIC